MAIDPSVKMFIEECDAFLKKLEYLKLEVEKASSQEEYTIEFPFKLSGEDANLILKLLRENGFAIRLIWFSNEEDRRLKIIISKKEKKDCGVRVCSRCGGPEKNRSMLGYL